MDGVLGKSFLKDYQQKTDSLFQDYLNEKISQADELGAVPAELVKRFAENARLGKKLRGALVVLGYLIGGGKDLDAIYETSLFIELFHAGVLVHDDIMDNDPFRRGLPTLHKQFEKRGAELEVKSDPAHYGESMAICAGDLAYYLSYELLLKGKFSPELIMKAAQVYTHYIIRLLHGQVLDITITGAKDLKEADVLNVIWTKSGEYTSLLPLQIGAILGGLKDEKKLKALNEYARCFGWAFHIQDDILGMFGDEEEMGKPVGSDLREGKNTLFMLHLEKNGNEEQIEFKRKALGNSEITKEDVEKMRQVLRDSGSYDHVVNLGHKYVEDGKKFIPDFTDNPDLQDIFESLLVYMMERIK